MDNWYLCEDQLPDVEDTYLVLWYYKDYKKPILFYEILEYVDGQWWVDIPQAGDRDVVIHAWQELPPIPEEVKVC